MPFCVRLEVLIAEEAPLKSVNALSTIVRGWADNATAFEQQ